MSFLKHNFNPVFNKNSEILILGTFPSVKSRENDFYYGHPKNRFWKLMACITNTKEFPNSIEAKTNMLLNNKIAVWDIVNSCQITGSSDSSIKNIVPNNINIIIINSNIKKIYTNGNMAFKLSRKYLKEVDIPIIKLPSTSPANARWSFEMLLKEWIKII